MTARLATHPDVADCTMDVLERLVLAGVDVEFAEGGSGADSTQSDPLSAVRESTVHLALVGIQALRGSAADDLTTVAVLPRGETRDVLVSLTGTRRPLSELPRGTPVGHVGARRGAFLSAHRPDVDPVPLTSVDMDRLLGCLADGTGSGDGLEGLQAVVLSAISARRAGLSDATVEALDPKAWLPEPGQGALALLARHPIAEATALDHLPTRTALRTELALLEALGADADAPLGCLAQPSGRWIRLWAAAASPDGRRLVRSDLTGPLDEAEALGAAVARELEARGYRLVTAAAT